MDLPEFGSSSAFGVPTVHLNSEPLAPPLFADTGLRLEAWTDVQVLPWVLLSNWILSGRARSPFLTFTTEINAILDHLWISPTCKTVYIVTALEGMLVDRG